MHFTTDGRANTFIAAIARAVVGNTVTLLSTCEFSSENSGDFAFASRLLAARTKR